MSIMNRTFK